MSTAADPTTPPDPAVEGTPAAPGFLASGRHPVNIGHLVMGVAFAGLVVVWALVTGDVVEGDDIRWLLPVPWVLAGAAGLVGLVAADRRRAGARQQGWVGRMEE